MAGAGADPRPSNTGVTPPPPLTTPPPLGAGLTSRFDWYELTADGLDDGRCAPALALATGARVTAGRARNGYSHAENVTRGEDVLAVVYGGSARAGEVHIAITGLACDELVPLVRRLWPRHRVSRADVALDFLADFDELDGRLVAFADGRGLKHEVIRNSEGGATRYLGARSSETRTRCYRKSEQLIALHPERADEIPRGVVRLELQARPGKRAIREAVALLEPDEVWGIGEWSQLLAQEVLALNPPRTVTHFRRPSDWSRSLHFLGLQYGPLVQARALDVGLAQAQAEVLAALGIS